MQEMDSFFPCPSISWRSAYIRTPYPSHRNASNTSFSIYKTFGRIWESKALHDPTRLEWRAIVYGVLHPFLIKDTFPFRNKHSKHSQVYCTEMRRMGGFFSYCWRERIPRHPRARNYTAGGIRLYVCIILLKRSERKLAVALGDVGRWPTLPVMTEIYLQTIFADPFGWNSRTNNEMFFFLYPLNASLLFGSRNIISPRGTFIPTFFMLWPPFP